MTINGHHAIIVYIIMKIDWKLLYIVVYKFVKIETVEVISGRNCVLMIN